MGTSCAIGYENIDGTINTTTIHWDSYPQGVGKDLIKYWSEDNKAYNLCKNDEIRSLGGSTVEVYRDARPNYICKDIDEFRNKFCGNNDYGYLYRCGKWRILNKDKNEWLYLENYLIENNIKI